MDALATGSTDYGQSFSVPVRLNTEIKKEADRVVVV